MFIWIPNSKQLIILKEHKHLIIKFKIFLTLIKYQSIAILNIAKKIYIKKNVA